ncbi:hypothetical protein OZX56_02755 [Lactobacillus sp. ESL0684]|uniref:hypothetical protein n=1 Tax=Lactobacillus sp. ESL0684 TaxID=2983213 RepID=UPI0023F7B239|nr:hypothetical protein [Lactobacillus sp. ESL0684]WEV44166.1 hypothetical protein OZX56_02755 [Lactobacillus sp. ESL0684]
MLKRTKKIISITIILYFFLITCHTFVSIKDGQGILSAGGNISVSIFFEMQAGGGNGSEIVDLTMMAVLSVIGSGLFIYIKNNNMFDSVQQRLRYKRFLMKSVITTFLAATGLSIFTNLYEMSLINWFYFPFTYKMNDPFLRSHRPSNFTNNDFVEILLFIILGAVGWGIFAIFIFSIGLFVRKNAFYIIVGPIIGLVLILLPILGNIHSLIWRVFSYSWFVYTLIAPGQYTFISEAPPIKPGLSFIIAAMIYLAAAVLLISIWYKKQRKEA